MVSLIRRYRQPLLICFTFLIIIAFVWLYNDTSRYGRGSDVVGTVYGRNVTQPEFTRTARKFELSRVLMLFDVLRGLVGNARSQDEAVANFAWNTMILRHEADALGIQPPDTDVIEAIQKMMPFQTSGVYDSSRYVNFVATELSPRGLTEDALYDVVRDDLRLRRIKELLGSTAEATPSELRSLYEQRQQKTELSFVRLKLTDFEAAVQVSDEDLKKVFEERKGALKSDEKRKVKYLGYTLEKQTKPMVGKERMDAMQGLADKAADAAIALAEPGAKLEDVAAKHGAEVKETPEFTAEDPPAEFGGSEAVTQAAFALTKEAPNSDALSGDNGYYVLQLGEIIEARPLTFEEAKGNLAVQLKRERAMEQMGLKATEIRNKLEAELKAGKALADAATAAGTTVEVFPPFSPAEPKLDQPDAREIMTRARDLNVGQVSDFIPTQTGGLLLHVDRRQPVDEAGFEKEKGNLTDALVNVKREAMFQQWLKVRREEANPQFAGG